MTSPEIEAGMIGVLSCASGNKRSPSAGLPADRTLTTDWTFAKARYSLFYKPVVNTLTCTPKPEAIVPRSKTQFDSWQTSNIEVSLLNTNKARLSSAPRAHTVCFYS